MPIFSTFWRNQVLHSYFSFLTWQLRNIEVAGVCGRPQNFVVNGFVKPSYCLLKRGPQSLFLVSFQYLGPWASWKVRKPYLYIKSKKNVGLPSLTFPYLTSISHFWWLIKEINKGQVSCPPMSSSDWDLTFTWHSPDTHLNLTWPPDHHLTFPWPLQDPYLT